MGDPHRQLEHLRKLAAANPTKRFGKLLKVIRHDAFLQMVWHKVRTNKGSRTPGVDGQTKEDVDEHVLHDLAHDLATRHYRPQPVRRTYIPKRGKPGQRRALGIPAIRDRIVQAAIAQVLNALYEPLFRSCSYGFRPGHSPIHALRHVARAYRSGVTWVVEGDLERCFDRIDHSVLEAILQERFHDNRFLRLLRGLLQAGYLEEWTFNATYSGVPQGGVVSPILSNLVLDRLDKYVETHLIPAYTRGDRRRTNPPYVRLTILASEARKQGEWQRARILRQQAQRIASRDPHDPHFRRLWYVRYADGTPVQA